MDPIARIAAAMIHPRLRSISGIWNSLLGMRGSWSRLHIQASPDCPPKDAAAAEIAIVLRDPRSAGPLYRRVLMRFGIPVAVQADLAATRTTTEPASR